MEFPRRGTLSRQGSKTCQTFWWDWSDASVYKEQYRLHNQNLPGKILDRFCSRFLDFSSLSLLLFAASAGNTNGEGAPDTNRGFKNIQWMHNKSATRLRTRSYPTFQRQCKRTNIFWPWGGLCNCPPRRMQVNALWVQLHQCQKVGEGKARSWYDGAWHLYPWTLTRTGGESRSKNICFNSEENKLHPTHVLIFNRFGVGLCLNEHQH